MKTLRDSSIGACGEAEAYVLGVLEEQEREAFEGHLPGCADCQGLVRSHALTLHSLGAAFATQPPPAVRESILDLAEAPPVPEDPGSLQWEALAPGVNGRLIRSDRDRNFEAWLIWARPGARNPRHRHKGDETILVLQGALRDDRGDYREGAICRSGAGSVHTEEALPGADCFCYVLSYGGIERIE